MMKINHPFAASHIQQDAAQKQSLSLQTGLSLMLF
jgi:hypothetical protein